MATPNMLDVHTLLVQFNEQGVVEARVDDIAVSGAEVQLITDSGVFPVSQIRNVVASRRETPAEAEETATGEEMTAEEVRLLNAALDDIVAAIDRVSEEVKTTVAAFQERPEAA